MNMTTFFTKRINLDLPIILNEFVTINRNCDIKKIDFLIV